MRTSCAGREPQAGLLIPIFTGACFAFLAARFSFSDFPGFLPESFCGDLLATSSSFTCGSRPQPHSCGRETSDRADAAGLHALFALGDFKLNPLAFEQLAVALRLNL